jgi:hypothetical protein
MFPVRSTFSTLPPASSTFSFHPPVPESPRTMPRLLPILVVRTPADFGSFSAAILQLTDKKQLFRFVYFFNTH